VKFNQIEEGSFDYRALEWEATPEYPTDTDARPGEDDGASPRFEESASHARSSSR
jgi:hypothetical protein